ncbi:MAG: hypothetical protein RJQ09_02445 [Cyclobacteriaceae bacterium]
MIRLLVISLFSGQIFGQTATQSADWFEIKKGQYLHRSTDSTLLSVAENFIEPQLATEDLGDRLRYLSVSNNIALFNKDNPGSEKDISGVLDRSSIINLIHTDYKQTFQNPDTSWRYSWEVWHKLEINGKEYYTDLRIQHILTTYDLPHFNQVVVLTAEDTGYDNFYDLGYPEHFNFLVFEKDGTEKRLKYQSGELDFICNCEFWEEESEVSGWQIIEDGVLRIVLIGLENKYSAIWDGELLKPVND